MTKSGRWREVAADCREVVLVCRKCSKKLGGGFGPGGDQRLAKALRRVFREDAGRTAKPRRRAVAIVETGCLDVCPKGAVVALRAAAPGRWVLVPEGAPPEDVAERLGLAPQLQSQRTGSA